MKSNMKTSESEINSNIATPHLENKKSNWINEFLWSCAGVNKQVLRQCPSDYAKYAGIGGTILFTALMACFSGGYALTFVFGDWRIGSIFGIFWGLLIFNLDRFIVNTMYSDGKVTISWQELKAGLPRIIMAIFLGVVISYPLELKLFDDEIQVKIDEMKKERLQNYIADDQQRLDSLEREVALLRETPPSIHETQIVGGNEQLNMLNEQRKNFEAKFNAEQQQINSISATLRELRATNENGQNDSKIATKSQELLNHQILRNKHRSDLNQVKAEMASLSPQIKELIDKQSNDQEQNIARKQADIDILKNKIQRADSVYKTILEKNFHGLQAQMLAFSEMKKSKSEDEIFSSTQIAALLIMLLFIIIETTPTFFKMMMASGPYDDLLRAEMHRVHVLSQKRISDVNDEVNTSVRITTMKNQKRLEAEVIANEDILKQIAKVQSELLQKSIDAWRKDELRKIAENPTAYIKIKTNEQQEP